MTESSTTRERPKVMTLIARCGMAWIGSVGMLVLVRSLRCSRRARRGSAMSDDFAGTPPVASFPLVIVYEADGTRRIFCENEQAAVEWVWLLTAIDGIDTMSVYDRRLETERWAS